MAEPIRLDSESLGELAAVLAPAIAAAMPAPGALLDADGAAALLAVPSSWVLAEARASRIPHVRLGRYVRFERDELLAWLHRSPDRDRGPRRRTGAHPVSNGSEAR